MAKLHPRFRPVDKYDRDGCRCATCDKVRATCSDCESCSECCHCDYCPLCGLPNDWRGECTCFQCEDCHKTKPEIENVLDDGNYANPDEVINFNTRIDYICVSCYAKREAAWKLATSKGITNETT